MRAPQKTLAVVDHKTGWRVPGSAIRDQLGLVARLDLEPEDYFDYQFNRPTVALDETVERPERTVAARHVLAACAPRELDRLLGLRTP